MQINKNKEGKGTTLEEGKLQLQVGERRQSIELEKMKLMFGLEDKEKMREFELNKLPIQTEIDSHKDVEISAPKAGTGKSFVLLKLFKPYDNAKGDICMYLTYIRDK